MGYTREEKETMCPDWTIYMIMPERNGEEKIIEQPTLEIEANKEITDI